MKKKDYKKLLRGIEREMGKFLFLVDTVNLIQSDGSEKRYDLKDVGFTEGITEGFERSRRLLTKYFEDHKGNDPEINTAELSDMILKWVCGDRKLTTGLFAYVSSKGHVFTGASSKSSIGTLGTFKNLLIRKLDKFFEQEEDEEDNDMSGLRKLFKSNVSEEKKLKTLMDNNRKELTEIRKLSSKVEALLTELREREIEIKCEQVDIANDLCNLKQIEEE